jgi:hypothetical protein
VPAPPAQKSEAAEYSANNQDQYGDDSYMQNDDAYEEDDDDDVDFNVGGSTDPAPVQVEQEDTSVAFAPPPPPVAVKGPNSKEDG